MGDAQTTVCKRLERISGIAMNTCARIGTEGVHAGNAEELLELNKQIRGEADAIGKHLAKAIERFGAEADKPTTNHQPPATLRFTGSHT